MVAITPTATRVLGAIRPAGVLVVGIADRPAGEGVIAKAAGLAD